MDKLFRLFSFYKPMCFVYDNDSSAGGDGDGADGGGDNSSKGGGGGDNKTGDDSSSKKDDTYTIKVAGEDRQVSLDELKTLATKSAGADELMREAAGVRKGGEKGSRIGSLIDKLSGSDAPSDADIKELAGLLGEDPSKFLEQLKTEEGKTTETATSSAKVTKEDLAEALGVDPVEMKAILQHSKDRHVSDAQKELRGISDLAVDKDEIIGKMIVGKDKDSVLLAVKDMVAEDVLRKIQNGETYGAELVATVVQSVRSRLTKLGIPNKPSEQPIVLGLGPGQALPVEVQADEPIKRISAAEDTDDSNVVARYMQMAIKAVRERKQS